MRNFAWMLMLLTSCVFAQTYVRPSKGAALTPFAVLSDFTVLNNTSDTWVFPKANVGAYPKYVQWQSRVYDWTAFNGVRATLSATDCGVNSSLSKTVVFREVASYIRFNLTLSGVDGTTSSAYFSLKVLGGASPSNVTEIDLSLSPDSTGEVSMGYGSQACNKVELILTPLPFTEDSTVKIESSQTVDTRNAASWCRSAGNRRYEFGVMSAYTNKNSLVMTGSDIFREEALEDNDAPSNDPTINQYIKLCNSPLSLYGPVMCRRFPRYWGGGLDPTWTQYGQSSMIYDYVNAARLGTGTATMLLPGQCVEYNFGPYWSGKNIIPLGGTTGASIQDFQCAGNVGQILDVTICKQQL